MHELVYEIWSPMMNGDGVSGTIRTVPQNYYVATVNEKSELKFEGLEVNTREINQDKVRKLWDANKIPRS